MEQLANTHAQAGRVTQEIETTGWVIPSPKNPEQKIRNPLLDALTLVRSSQLNLTRAPALDGPPADRKTISKKARTVVDARRTVEQNDRLNLLGDARHHRNHHRPRHAGDGLGHSEQEGGLSMSWQEGVAVTVVLIGLGAGAFLVAQRPSFWIEFGSWVAKSLLPLAWRYISKRKPPEEEAAWREAERRGQGDEWLKQLYRLRRKTQT